MVKKTIDGEGRKQRKDRTIKRSAITQAPVWSLRTLFSTMHTFRAVTISGVKPHLSRNKDINTCFLPTGIRAETWWAGTLKLDLKYFG